MSDEYFRIAKHWYPENFPFEKTEESIEQLNSIVPVSWEYVLSYDEQPGVYLVEYTEGSMDG